MTNGEVEFLGGEPEPAPPRRRIGAADLGPVVGWLLAAALAAVAPFLPLYTEAMPRRYADYQSAADGFSTTGPDGWGEPGNLNFGIPLVVCAAAFALVAGLGVLGLLRLRWGRPGPAVTLGRAAVGAPCLLAGVVGVLALYVSSATGPAEFGWFAYAPLNAGSSAYGSTLSISGGTSPGWCLWLAVIALACGVAATAVHLVAARRTEPAAGEVGP